MIVDCIADLHGDYEWMKGGEFLIVAGDLTRCDQKYEYEEFFRWFRRQPYKHKIMIAGNHDGLLEAREIYERSLCPHDHYLEDETIILSNGLKIFGSPWTPPFFDWHFMKDDTPNGLGAIYKTIPDGCDIIITHGPPHGILDKTIDGENAGSKELAKAVKRIKPRLHVFGHIHEGYGVDERDGTIYVNCARMTVDYKPVNKPIRIEL